MNSKYSFLSLFSSLMWIVFLICSFRINDTLSRNLFIIFGVLAIFVLMELAFLFIGEDGYFKIRVREFKQTKKSDEKIIRFLRIIAIPLGTILVIIIFMSVTYRFFELINVKMV